MPAQDFPRNARVLAKASFDAAFADGRRCGTRFFRASVTDAPDQAARLGLAVSRRVSRRAVERNRIKRCTRESFRATRSALPALDIVVTAKPEAAQATSAELRLDLSRLWPRVAALKAVDRGGTMRGAP